MSGRIVAYSNPLFFVSLDGHPRTVYNVRSWQDPDTVLASFPDDTFPDAADRAMEDAEERYEVDDLNAEDE